MRWVTQIRAVPRRSGLRSEIEVAVRDESCTTFGIAKLRLSLRLAALYCTTICEVLHLPAWAWPNTQQLVAGTRLRYTFCCLHSIMQLAGFSVACLAIRCLVSCA